MSQQYLNSLQPERQTTIPSYQQQLQKSELYRLHQKSTSESFGSHATSSGASSIYSGISTVSQKSHSVRRGQLNKELPPLPPQTDNSNTSKPPSNLKVPPPRPIRPSSSFNQLPPSDFRNRILSESLPSKKHSSKQSITPNDQSTLTKTHSSSSSRIHLIPKPQIKHSVSHNQLLPNHTRSASFFKTNASESNVNKYSSGLETSFDNDSGMSQKSSLFVPKQRGNSMNRSERYSSRKTSASSTTSLSLDQGQRPRAESFNVRQNVTVPVPNQVCFIFFI